MVTIIKRGTSKKEIEQRIKGVISKLPKNDILKFAGKLKTDIDPSLYQMKMRNEWK
jgi:hypothetical protein